MTGKMYSDFWSRIAAILMCVGFFMTFIPQFVVGYLGMPRRYHQYLPEFQVYNVLSSAGSTVLALGYLFPFTYLIHSIFYGKPAGDNPWGATGLEWKTSSPPPTFNFNYSPVVAEMPYEYSLPTAPKPTFSYSSNGEAVKEEPVHVH
jgi:cytochrome c oxidase subunit 1